MQILQNSFRQVISNSICLFRKVNLDLNVVQSRTKVIYLLPKPTEVKRVRKQGYLKRVKTPSGRRYIMERILRGDKVVAQ